jgi:glucan phosphoethanolaminetransferase (alkaline phosphatase superfamily)
MTDSVQLKENTAKALDPTLWYLVFFVLILSPRLSELWVAKSPHAAIALFVQLVVVVTLHLTFNWRKWLVAWVAPFALLAIFDTLYFWEYRDALTLRVLAIVVQTPLHETFSYIAGRFWEFALAIALWLVVCIKVWKAPEPIPIEKRYQKRLKFGAALACAALFVLAMNAFANPRHPNALSESGFDQFLVDCVANSYPYKPFRSALSYLESDAKYHELQNKKLATNITPKVRLDPGFFQSDPSVAVILVLGESSNRSRWSLYGYERSTTPKLAGRSGLIRLDDVVTPWPSTMAAIPVMMTQKSATDLELYTSEPGLSRILQSAGYETYWISNQGSQGSFDRSIRQLYSEAQYQDFASGPTALGIGQRGDDARLLPSIQGALASKTKKVFVVVHTQGSHYPFWERYPASSERFTPAKRGEEFFNNRIRNWDWEAVSNSYDNTIVHTDLVLDQIIDAADRSGRDVRLVYVSDHGQTIPDATCSELGQGYFKDVVLRVPAFIWLSSHLRQARPELIKVLADNSKRPISTTSIFPTVLALAGVQFDGVAENSGLTSKHFIPSPQIVNTARGAVSFSSLTRGEGCK